MRLPARRIADAHAANRQGATYVAQFSWGAHVEGEAWERGAFHAIDLPFTFGTLDRAGWAEFLGAGRTPSSWRSGTWPHGRASPASATRALRSRTVRPARPVRGPLRQPERATMILDTRCEVGDDPLAVIAHAWDGLWSAECRAPSLGV